MRAGALVLIAVVGGCITDEKPAAPKPNKPVAPQKGAKRRALEALPYMSWVPIPKQDRGKSGVTQHNPRLAFQGINFYGSRPRSTAQLINMNGKVLHAWSSNVGQPSAEEMKWTELWPHLDHAGWHHVELALDGFVYAINAYHSILKLDRDSKVVWSASIDAHHDLAFADSGDILALASQSRQITFARRKMVILDNHIVTLSPKGKVKRRFSLYEVLQRDKTLAEILWTRLRWAVSQFDNNLAFYYLVARLLQTKKKVNQLAIAVQQLLDGTFEGPKRVAYTLMSMLAPMDPLHLNSIEILGRDVKGVGKRGDLLLSLRELDLILVLDSVTTRVRWSWGPRVLNRQHQPSMLKGGHILIFDNGPRRGHSRLVELDPVAKKIVWTYKGSPPRSFFSGVRGGCHALPNGNVLVTDSERGRVFEVTRDGKMVWEFFNPDLKSPYVPDRRAPIYRMARFGTERIERMGLVSRVSAE
jgi:hypothetical protein